MRTPTTDREKMLFLHREALVRRLWVCRFIVVTLLNVAVSALIVLLAR